MYVKLNQFYKNLILVPTNGVSYNAGSIYPTVFESYNDMSEITPLNVS